MYVSENYFLFTDPATGEQAHYSIKKEKKNWQQADEHCQKEGGRLASPSTKAKYDFILEKLEPFKTNYYSYFWIGATRPAAFYPSTSKNGWKYVTGENVSVGDWWPGQPNGSGTCLIIEHHPSDNSGNFGWVDAGCEWSQYFICEVSTNTGR